MMAKTFSWVDLQAAALGQQETFSPSKRDSSLTNRAFTTNVAIDELDRLRPELGAALYKDRLSLKLLYPEAITRELRQEFIMRLNAMLPSPFYVVHSIQNKGESYIVMWAMLPTE